MPDFVHDGKAYYNPVEFAMDRIGGLWKAPILWRLRRRTLRYSELKRSIQHISDKVLSSQLRDLERHGLIIRNVYAEVPARTEYELSEDGREAIPVVSAIRDYGLALMRDAGVDVTPYLQAAAEPDE